MALEVRVRGVGVSAATAARNHVGCRLHDHRSLLPCSFLQRAEGRCDGYHLF
jgi:hypothetical protein